MSSAQHASPIKGTQASCCFKKYLFIGICLRKSTQSTTISAQLWWLQISKYQFFLSRFSSPSISHFSRGLRCNSAASPSHQQYIIPLQKADTPRQITGKGRRNLMIPAAIMGSEQATVKRIVKTILISNVIAASNLDIINSFKELTCVRRSCHRRRALILSEMHKKKGALPAI